MADINVVNHIQIHITTLADRDGQIMGWVYTHGMDSLGFPELEIRELPLFMGPAAAGILNATADYVVNCGKPVKVGERLDLEGMAIVEFAKLPPVVGHENPVERWSLVTPEFMRCECHQPDHVDVGAVTMPDKEKKSLAN